MRKTNKNLTKQILTLMLAFVMVFTGMGIGSWGVDTAWADDWDGTTISPPSQSEDGTYQISNAAELAWFAGLVNGTLTDGTTQNLAANAVLTENIDLNNKNWTPIGKDKNSIFSGVFDGKGHTISNLKISNGAVGAGFFGYSSGTIKDFQIKQAEVTGTKTCAILLASNEKNGQILQCSVVDSTLNVNTMGGAISGTNAGSTSIKNCFARGNTINANFAEKDGKYALNGNIGGLVGNARSVTLNNSYVAETTITNSGEGKKNGEY